MAGIREMHWREVFWGKKKERLCRQTFELLPAVKIGSVLWLKLGVTASTWFLLLGCLGLILCFAWRELVIERYTALLEPHNKHKMHHPAGNLMFLRIWQESICAIWYFTPKLISNNLSSLNLGVELTPQLLQVFVSSEHVSSLVMEGELHLV